MKIIDVTAQKMESSVNRMTDAETRSVWKDQLLEVQQELQAATEAMMSRACTSKAGQEEGEYSIYWALTLLTAHNSEVC